MSIFYWDESEITDAVFGKAIAPTSLENSGSMTTVSTAELEALRTKAKAGELDEDRWEWIERNQIRGHIFRKVVEITRQSIDDAMKVPQ